MMTEAQDLAKKIIFIVQEGLDVSLKTSSDLDKASVYIAAIKCIVEVCQEQLKKEGES